MQWEFEYCINFIIYSGYAVAVAAFSLAFNLEFEQNTMELFNSLEEWESDKKREIVCISYRMCVTTVNELM